MEQEFLLLAALMQILEKQQGEYILLTASLSQMERQFHLALSVNKMLYNK